MVSSSKRYLTTRVGLPMTTTLSFIKMGSSIWFFLSNRKSKELEVVSICLLSLVDATVSLVTTQRVLLAMEEGSVAVANSAPLFSMLSVDALY